MSERNFPLSASNAIILRTSNDGEVWYAVAGDEPDAGTITAEYNLENLVKKLDKIAPGLWMVIEPKKIRAYD